jgi:hypothetical protein
MNVSESLVIPASPDAVWRIGGDAGNIADWLPAIEKSHLVGDIRHATFAGGGGDATERIVEHNDAGKYYVYEYLTGPLPLKFYRARFEVGEHPEGCIVTWSSEFGAGSAEEEAALAQAIAGIYRDGMAGLAVAVTGG